MKFKINHRRAVAFSILATLLSATASKAAVTFTAYYVSIDDATVIERSDGGSLDLSLWSFVGNFTTNAYINNTSLLSADGSFDIYEPTAGANYSGPAFLGTNSLGVSREVDTVGSPAGFGSTFDDSAQLFVPAGYVSGDPLGASTAVWTLTLSELGLTPGTSVWTWDTSGGGTDSVTFTVIPEPSSALLVGLDSIGLVFCRRR